MKTPSSHRRMPSAIAAFLTWNDTRLTRRALSRLSRHERRDIGYECAFD